MPSVKYYKAIAAGGHMGSGRQRELVFYIHARNICDALHFVKRMPAVKHTRLPLNITEIPYSEFIQHQTHNAYHSEVER